MGLTGCPRKIDENKYFIYYVKYYIMATLRVNVNGNAKIYDDENMNYSPPTPPVESSCLKQIFRVVMAIILSMLLLLTLISLALLFYSFISTIIYHKIDELLVIKSIFILCVSGAGFYILNTQRAFILFRHHHCI